MSLQVKRNLKYGALLYGTVTKVFDFGVLVKVNETDIGYELIRLEQCNSSFYGVASMLSTCTGS